LISISFLLTAFVIVLIPGTGVIYTINTGLTQKKRIMLAAAFGCTLGIIPHIVACILGLSKRKRPGQLGTLRRQSWGRSCDPCVGYDPNR